MPSIFCPHCVSEIVYSYNKPKECTSCGRLFAAASKAPSRARRKHIEDDEEEYEDEDYQPIRRVKIPKVIVDKPVFQQLGSIIGTEPGATRQFRQPVSKDDYKSAVFAKKDNSIGEDK